MSSNPGSSSQQASRAYKVISRSGGLAFPRGTNRITYVLDTQQDTVPVAVVISLLWLCPLTEKGD
jgi:hypothetical protein